MRTRLTQGSVIARWRSAARRLKTEVIALYFAARDRRAPWYARAVVGVTLAYALSPIDLIPDAIPVLGVLDDLVLIPLGIALALKLMPPHLMAEARARAAESLEKPGSRAGVYAVAAVWLALLLLVTWLVYRLFQ